MQGVEACGAETVAILLRQWSSAIFRYATATLRADSDPAVALKGAIHRPKTVHRRPLSRDQITDLLAATNKYGGYRTTVIAIHLILLTFVRPKELRQAHWSEVDFARREWGEPHIVPLSRQALFQPLSQSELDLMPKLTTTPLAPHDISMPFRKSRTL